MCQAHLWVLNTTLFALLTTCKMRFITLGLQTRKPRVGTVEGPCPASKIDCTRLSLGLQGNSRLLFKQNHAVHVSFLAL